MVPIVAPYSPSAVLVTGGAGFIGSNYVRHLLKTANHLPLIVLDLLTYAGRRDNLQEAFNQPNFAFVEGDIRDQQLVLRLMQNVDTVVHFAAESHVDRSIANASEFISTNVLGTHILLQAARECQVKRFLNISTDEVYGSIGQGFADEAYPLNPSSPYSASKASQDMMAHAHLKTFNTPVITTRSSNNFGPYQYPEKLIPLFITNAIRGIPLPLYGDGLHVRDWLFVEDHCKAIDHVIKHGTVGEVYNIGGGNERTNLDLTSKILEKLSLPKTLIKPVPDRLGHDRRYALNCEKLHALGWRPKHTFEEAIASTIEWYQTHSVWWQG